MYAGVHYGGAGYCEGAGDAAEQAGMVCGVDGDFGDSAGVAGFGHHGEGGAAGFGVTHQAGVAELGIGVKGEPVAGVAQACEKGAVGIVPVGGLQDFVDGGAGALHAYVAFGGGQAAGQHFGDAGVEVS